MADTCDVAIIGGGLAGLTAGLYTSRYGLKTIVFEKLMPGGQVLNIGKLETLPGFPQGVSGIDIGTNAQDQAIKAGADVRFTEITGIELREPYRVLHTGDGDVQAKAVILAGGSRLRKLGVPGEDDFFGRGVSQCANCDGGFFTEQTVAVVGGGDSALDEALVLTEYASKILILHRGTRFSAQQVLQDEVQHNPKIEVRWNTVVEEIIGTKEGVSAIRTKDTSTGTVAQVDVTGVFVFVGLEPNTEYLQSVLPLDKAGHVPVNLSMETPVPGILAAGDLRQHSSRQLISAAGDGATAAVSAARYIGGRQWPV